MPGFAAQLYLKVAFEFCSGCVCKKELQILTHDEQV